MKSFLFIVGFVFFSTINSQRCTGNYNESIAGECSISNECKGSLLAVEGCEGGGCCVKPTITTTASTCLTENDFIPLYKTSRAGFLHKILNYGINSAGICTNCQAKAAFLAIAATMTENFQKDEAIGHASQFTSDDNKYGNTQNGDGSLFRRRGFFGLRGRTMYQRVQTTMTKYQTMTNPQLAAFVDNAIEIAIALWKKPDLLNGPPLTQHADGTFYGFSMLWYRLTGDIDNLADATKQYSKFLRHLRCGGDLYPGQGDTCQYNATHIGTCSPDCIQGLEDAGEYCGCSGGIGSQCPNSPAHIRCCLDTCSQELKMDLGFVLDASSSVGSANYNLQLKFTKDLLQRANIGRNKTHVGIINYSGKIETLTKLNQDYELKDKLKKIDKATYFGSGTDTAGALKEAEKVFSYKNGLRLPEDGATPVIFVITDGASADRQATIAAAQVLKDKGINMVSVGVGNKLDLIELNAICSEPTNENYFPMTNYAALEQKLNQFTAKTCSEPTPVAENTTVTGECGKDKYKFLKIKIIIVGNKIKIIVKLFNGKVKLFFSFTSKNPKDPIDFGNYQTISTTTTTSSSSSSPRPTSSSSPKMILKDNDDEMSLIIDKPAEDVEFVYLGIKGVEEDNKFEVKFDDCANILCSSATSITKTITLLFITFIFYFFINKRHL
ncbi:hypothetical protein I4U23_005886 [Adineta vaga]|nr:hypothetical protein I4U23_005886 [Adineta vaga]